MYVSVIDQNAICGEQLYFDDIKGCINYPMCGEIEKKRVREQELGMIHTKIFLVSLENE
jgi:hypothetical protein